MIQTQQCSDPLTIFENSGTANAPRDTVTLPNGQVILVRGITLQEYGRIQDDGRDEEGTIDYAVVDAMYCVFGVLKPDGDQAFSKEHVGRLLAMPKPMIQPMVDMILDLSGIGSGSMSKLEKNWSTVTGGVQSSDSPATLDEPSVS